MIDDSADQGSADATEAIAARYINVARLFVVDDGHADDGAGNSATKIRPDGMSATAVLSCCTSASARR